MTYHILFNDGYAASIKAFSAADAMCISLERNPGRTITKCWTDYKDALGKTFGQQAAYIEYDVPPHKAVQPIAEQQEIK